MIKYWIWICHRIIVAQFPQFKDASWASKVLTARPNRFGLAWVCWVPFRLLQFYLSLHACPLVPSHLSSPFCPSIPRSAYCRSIPYFRSDASTKVLPIATPRSTEIARRRTKFPPPTTLKWCPACAQVPFRVPAIRVRPRSPPETCVGRQRGRWTVVFHETMASS